MKKRLVSILLMVALLVSLSACGGAKITQVRRVKILVEAILVKVSQRLRVSN